jgi:hypothetical protein
VTEAREKEEEERRKRGGGGETMDRKQRLIKTLLTAVAATVAVVAAQPAAAADLQASGTAQATSLVFTDVRSADGNTIIEGIQQGVIGGTLTGTWVEQFRLVVHPGGATNFHSFLTVVEPRTGAGRERCASSSTARHGPVTEGRFRTIDQSDTTVDVHAVLDFVAYFPTGTITYTGTYDCR